MADTHLGAFRDRELRRLNLQAFLGALDAVREEGCEFLVIAGDLFDSNLPDMSTVDRAAEGLRRLKDAGVRIYVFHGSHDRSPTEKGILDVLASAGLFETVGIDVGGGSEPRVVTDGPTGTVLSAVGGMRRTLERGLLETMDPGPLEEAARDAPLAIFGYHGPVKGMMGRDLEDRIPEAVPLDVLPRGFDYYALGHIHHHFEMMVPEGGLAAYPGPTFGATFGDLADDRAKGLLAIDADEDGKCTASHVPIDSAPVHMVELDATGMTGDEARESLAGMVEGIDPEGSVVLLRVYGTLTEGRPSDVSIPRVRETIVSGGAIAVPVSRAGLRSPERRAALEGLAMGDRMDPLEVSRKILGTVLEEHANPLPWLRGDGGVDLAMDLIEVLREDRKEALKGDREDAVRRRAMTLLDTGDRLGGGSDGAVLETGPDEGPPTLDDFGGEDG
jgi:DNA repair exonuclease SbcCD nuclease subunit